MAVINKMEPYQQQIQDDVSAAFKEKHKWVFVQAPTRCGKTVIFCNMVNTFLKGNDGKDSDALIVVHDEKILHQTLKTLRSWHGIQARIITSKTKSLVRTSLFETTMQPVVFVAMVETINNRMSIKTFAEEMQRVKIIIADEGHLGNFKKVYKFFPDAYRVAFSATPLASDKQDPLYPTWFTKVVCGPSTKWLIEYNKTNPARGVVQDITRVIDQLPEKDRYMLIDNGGDELFDQEAIGKELGKQIKNTVNNYIKFTYGKKMICFNANREHNEDVCAAFNLAGVPCKYVDSKLATEVIDAAFKWFEEAEGAAILCNVYMAAIGYDCPSCEGVILNTLTSSITKCKQMGARGCTPYHYGNGIYKTHSYVLDMCNNTKLHGEWSDDYNWEYAFYNPKVYKPGVAPKKECKNCLALNAASSSVCFDCGEPFTNREAKIDNVERSMRLISKDIDVQKTVQIFSSRSEHTAMYDIIRQVAFLARKRIVDESIINGESCDAGDFEYALEQVEFEEIWAEAQIKIREWRDLLGKKSVEIPYTTVRSAMVEKLEMYGFISNFKTGGIFLKANKL